MGAIIADNLCMREMFHLENRIPSTLYPVFRGRSNVNIKCCSQVKLADWIRLRTFSACQLYQLVHHVVVRL